MVHADDAHDKTQFSFSYGYKQGSILVKCSSNRGARSSGFTAIGPQFTDDEVRGYPVMKAAVRYSGRGYEALFGWVQIVTHRYGEGSEMEVEVDIAPQFSEYQNPFCFYGYKPTLYDAPRHNPGLSMDWTAYSFLCPLKIPDSAGKKSISPVTGFRWGYRLLAGKVIELFKPEIVHEEKWKSLKKEVENNYGDWEFSDKYVTKRIWA